MSTKKETIINAANTVNSLGYKLSDKAIEQVNNLENPKYDIAVVGKYQVGKSTLINKVFLSDNPILIEGQGLCTTSVATNIMYGDVEKLEIYKWGDKNEELLANSILAPTKDDLLKNTSCEKPEERTSLASSISKVCVYTPNETLKGYTVIDTPGVDDPNKELLINTTYRVIPNSDVAVLVVAPKQLDEIEIKLLRNKLFSQGVSKFAVLVSYNPEGSNCKSAEQRKNVIDTISAQLNNLGFEVNVAMYCYDETCTDILCNADQIRDYLNQFLANNAYAGRENKAAFVIKNELENLALELSTKLKLFDKAEAEREEFIKKVEQDIYKFKDECEGSFMEFENSAERLKSQYIKKFEEIVSRFVSDAKIDVANAETTEALRVVVEKINKGKEGLTSKFEEVSSGLYKDIESIIKNLGKDSVKSKSVLGVEVENVEVGEIKSFIPNSVLIQLLNVIILNPIIPMGWITAALAHILIKKGFNIVPAAMIINMINKPLITKGLESAENEAKANIQECVENYFDTILDKIHDEYNAYSQDKVDAMMRAIDDDDLDSSEKDTIIANKSKIESIIEAL